MERKLKQETLLLTETSTIRIHFHTHIQSQFSLQEMKLFHQTFVVAIKHRVNLRTEANRARIYSKLNRARFQFSYFHRECLVSISSKSLRNILQNQIDLQCLIWVTAVTISCKLFQMVFIV